jgi:hypothetical protein
MRGYGSDEADGVIPDTGETASAVFGFSGRGYGGHTKNVRSAVG